MEFNGLPLHPLVVHVVVVFAPLAALTGIVYAVRPAWRWWLRWPLVISAVIAAGAGVLAAYSGYSLEHMRDLQQLASVRTHQHRGSILRWLLLAFLVPAGLAAWFLGGPSAVASGWGSRDGRNGTAALALQVFLVLASIVVLVWVFLTGDSGARAIWGQ
ncbi:MAG TPA: DUF2231 domain-containing protein [Nocardioides sp.]|jgi:hypothetical protein|nr:DUF2231 domain-containing protein [Nocardioides sp.]